MYNFTARSLFLRSLLSNRVIETIQTDESELVFLYRQDLLATILLIVHLGISQEIKKLIDEGVRVRYSTADERYFADRHRGHDHEFVELIDRETFSRRKFRVPIADQCTTVMDINGNLLAHGYHKEIRLVNLTDLESQMVSPQQIQWSV